MENNIKEIEKAIQSIKANFKLWQQSEIQDGSFSWHLQNNLLLIEKNLTTPSSLPTDEEMKVMALEKVPVEMENERSQAGQYDCKKWDRELYFEGLKDMRSLLRTNFSSEKCEGDAVKIVNDLADWSKKYPRSQIYGYSRQEEMDGQLIALEERAKEFQNTNPPKQEQQTTK